MSDGAAAMTDRARPLSPVERRLWLLDQLLPGGPGYECTFTLRLRGTADPANFLAALRLLGERHPILGARVELQGEIPVILPAKSPIDLEVDDLRREAAPAEAARRIVAADAASPVETGTGPLLRTRMLLVDDEEAWLVLRVHTLAADPASQRILLTDLAAAYGSVVAGTEPRWPPLPMTCADQAAPVPEAELEAVDHEWRRLCAAAPAALELPVDRPDVASSGLSAGPLVRRLTGPGARRVEALAEAEGVTRASILLGALAAVLGRYSGARTVGIGTPVAGRPPSAADLVGRFEEYVGLPVDLTDEPSLRTLARRVGTTARAAERLAVPLDLLAQSTTGREAGSDPPVPVAFRADQPLRSPELPGLAVTLEAADVPELPFELSLVVSDLGPDDDVTLEWRYSTARFTPRAVGRVAGHLETLLEAAAAQPDAPMSGLPLLTDRETVGLKRWGRGPKPASGPDVLPEWFARTAAENAEAEAVRGWDGALTYAELDAASNRLGHHLRALGARPGVLIGVCLDRSAALLVALLGVLKTGAAYVPVEPTYPADRVAFLLESAACAALVTTSDLMTRLPETAARPVLLDTEREKLAARSSGPVGGGPGPDDAAYVIYTSGSTGRPKGVVVGHASLCNLLRAMAADPGLHPGETMVGVTTPAFDLSVPDLFLPLVSGARLVLASPDDTVDGIALGRLLEDAGADLFQATPSTWQLLLDAGWSGRPGLRAVVGGESVPAQLAARVCQRTAGVWNFYGPTEATVWSTAARLDGPAGAGLTDPLPIGCPLPGVEVAVVDLENRLVPVGVAGELLIGGAGLAQGYRDQPQLTRSRFVELPVTGKRRMYRSGDLVRWRADGRLEFAGRMDDQVKLRGFRIEPGEVEAALRAQSGIREAAVVLREDTPGEHRLVGYVVGPPALDPVALRASLGRWLPAYMVPTAYVGLPHLPRTPNGKLDSRQLPVPDEDRISSPGYVAPRTPVETAVAKLWTEVLGVERIGVHDDFFDLGGHSLLVLRVAARLPGLLPVSLPVRRFFEATTVESLAVAITQAIAGRSVDAELADLLSALEASGDRAS